MDNRLKRDLVKFFKKMNKNNLSLFKEDKSKLKDIEKIEDDESLIQEGLKQCQFVLKHFSEKKDISLKEKEKEEKQEIKLEQKENKLKKKDVEMPKEIKEEIKVEVKKDETKNEIKKDELKKEIKMDEPKEEIKKDEIKKEIKKDQPKEEQKEEPKKEIKELTGLEAIKGKTKQKEKQEEKVLTDNKPKNKEKTVSFPSPKIPILKRLPTLSQLTDEQFGSTENAVYDLGDGIKIKVSWKYLRDKTYIPKEDEEDPEKFEKVDLIFTTNYIDPLILHWGVFRAFHESEWIHPEKECYPEYSKDFDKKAIQTNFTQDETEEWPSIRIMLKRGIGFENVIGGINFVIYDPVKNRWYNNYRKDFQIKFKLKVNKKKSKMILINKHLSVPEFVSDIITCESSYGSWTLMHRYNKCCDVINDWD